MMHRYASVLPDGLSISQPLQTYTVGLKTDYMSCSVEDLQSAVDLIAYVCKPGEMLRPKGRMGLKISLQSTVQ